MHTPCLSVLACVARNSKSTSSSATQWTSRRRRRTYLTAASALIVIVVAASCGDATEPGPPVFEVSIAPCTAPLASPGEEVQLIPTARDENGNVVSGKTFSWSSSNGGVATVSESGLVTAVGDGSVTVTAVTDGVDGSATVVVGQVVATLVESLEYPEGLWIADGTMYLTETSGRNTAFGGRVTLNRYDIGTCQLTMLVDNPVNADAVVGDAGNIYLASPENAVPGNLGNVSRVDPVTLTEAPLVTLQISAKDMFLDVNGDIYVIGASNDVDAESLYLLPAGNYANPSVVARGLGVAWSVAKVDADIYYGELSGINLLDGAGNSTIVLSSGFIVSLSASDSFLYYADFTNELIGRVDLVTGADEPVVGLAGVNAIRYDRANGVLYIAHAGTSTNEFRDGSLRAVYGLP